MVRIFHQITRPLEAGLGAFVDLGKDTFIGRDALLEQKTHGVPDEACRDPSFRKNRRRSGRITRYWPAEKGVAETTSGALSPSLGCGIALAYLPFPLAKAGQDLEIEVRGRRYRAAVVKKPFYNPKS